MAEIKHMKLLLERIADIQKEIKGVAAQYNVNSFELNFMRDMQAKNINVGSVKQVAVIRKIEVKVFGENYSYEKDSKEITR